MDLIATLGTGSREELHTRLQAQLGLDTPASDRALAAVMTSQWFAGRVAAARDSPDALHHLLANPRTARVSALGHLREPVPAPCKTERADQAGKHSFGRSALTWLRNVLRGVDEDTRARRREACRGCPHRRDGISGALHRMTSAVVTGVKTGAPCRCDLRAKTAVPYEGCPDEDLARPGLTRWSDPILHQQEEA